MIRSTEVPVAYRTSFSGKLDRLSSLIDRLRVQVANAMTDDPGGGMANLVIYADPSGEHRLVYCPLLEEEETQHFPETAPVMGEAPLVAANIAISGIGKQLINALPACISVPLSEEPYLTAVVTPLIEEATMPRCGGQAAFQRLCEVVVIRLLRHAMEEGKANTGLLNGLAHPRVAAALVAIHEAPGEAWTLERLAETAGMSRTQFAVTFKDLVGATPMGYLSNWRLDIARAELEGGRQVKSVATICGFSSPAAFSRAFSRRFGYPPKQKRKQAAA
ncbi:AraC-like DNA-binding protein [Labrenzia sp. EL_13]|nr:AraC-like DNA-binding protein [Labrenzia sp. EL_142]MBG6205292.1 AraC-like DNA-binding protein [Labrenzia sp. EL_13]